MSDFTLYAPIPIRRINMMAIIEPELLDEILQYSFSKEDEDFQMKSLKSSCEEISTQLDVGQTNTPQSPAIDKFEKFEVFELKNDPSPSSVTQLKELQQ